MLVNALKTFKLCKTLIIHFEEFEFKATALDHSDGNNFIFMYKIKHIHLKHQYA